MRRSAIWVILVAIALVSAVAWWHYHHLYHFAVVREGVLYRDGNHSAAEFEAAMRQAQPRTVVSLVDDDEFARPQFQAEAAYCKTHGIDLVRIPIKLGGWPTDDEVRQFLSVVSDNARQPVLVHCAQGVRRTGMMVAAYQESVLRYDADKARAAILSFGHSEHTIGDVKKFIDVYDANSMKVSTTLPTTTE